MFIKARLCLFTFAESSFHSRWHSHRHLVCCSYFPGDCRDFFGANFKIKTKSLEALFIFKSEKNNIRCCWFRLPILNMSSIARTRSASLSSVLAVSAATARKETHDQVVHDWEGKEQKREHIASDRNYTRRRARRSGTSRSCRRHETV